MKNGNENKMNNDTKQDITSEKNSYEKEIKKDNKLSYRLEDEKSNDYNVRYEQRSKAPNGYYIGSSGDRQKESIKVDDLQRPMQDNKLYPVFGVNNDLQGSSYQLQPIQNAQQTPINQAFQYTPTISGRNSGQYIRENNLIDRYDTSGGLADFNRPFSDFLRQSENLQVGLVEDQKDALMTNIGGIWAKYTSQVDVDEKSNTEKCKQNNKNHKEEMEKFDKNLDKEIKNINTSLKGLIKDIFNNVDNNIKASQSEFITIYRLMSDLSDDYGKKTKDSEDSKGAYFELQQDLKRMADGHKFSSVNEIKESLHRYKNFIGKRYSMNIVSSFFYSLIDLIFGTNYHADFSMLSENTEQILTEIERLDEMSESELNSNKIRIINLINIHRKILAAMPSWLFEVGKNEVDFTKIIEDFLKTNEFSQTEDILGLFHLCGAEVFSVAYMNSSEAKKSFIINLLASKLDFLDSETKKTGEEVFGLGNENDFFLRKKNIITLMLSSKEDDSDKRVNEVLKKINNLDKLTEPLDPNLEIQKRIISKYCGGRVLELINKTIGKKFKEKTSLQEQLYYVDIINAKNDDFDAKKKRVKTLVFDVTSELKRYYNQHLYTVSKSYTYEEMRNINFSSDHFRKQGYVLLTGALGSGVEMLKKVINDEFGDYKKDKEDSLKNKKESIKQGINERRTSDGKTKERKALDIQRLEDWDDRNLDKEGYEFREQLLKDIDNFAQAMEKDIEKNFSNIPVVHKNGLDEQMRASSKELQGIYKDIEMRKADANKESYDKMFQVLANNNKGVGGWLHGN